MATKAKQKIVAGNWVNYRLPDESLNHGEVRRAKVLKVNSDNSLNLVVELQDGDFSEDGRVMHGVEHKGKVVSEVMIGKVLDGYLYVNHVESGDTQDTWSA